MGEWNLTRDILDAGAALTCRLVHANRVQGNQHISERQHSSPGADHTFSVHLPAFTVDEEWNCTTNLMATRVDLAK